MIRKQITICNNIIIMERKFSLLYEAAHEGNVTTLRELVQQDRLILDRLIVINNNGFSETPLHVAAMLGHADFVKEILNRKPELAKELDTWRSTPLHLAAAKGHVETVKVLLSVFDRDIMCFAGDREGRNPIHLAAMRGRLDVLGELVRVAPGAVRVTLVGRSETALHLCVRYNQLEALRLLVEVVDDFQFVNAKDDYGMTVLHLAVADKQIETVKFLLTNTRIDVNAVNANGFTALDMLAQSQRNEKDFDISECLRAAGALRTIEPPLVPRQRPTQTIGSTSRSPIPFVPHNQYLIPETSSLGQTLPKDHYIIKKPEDWLTRKREALMVVASLIATMAFQAGTNPPGGLWQDDSPTGVSQGAGDNTTNLHKAGESIMAYNPEGYYSAYLYCNTVGFIASLSIILLLITGLPFCRKLFMCILTVIMWVTITAMALTYVISISIFTPQSEADLERHVVSYLVLGWAGVMALILLLHTIRLMGNFFKKLINCLFPRRKTFNVGNYGSF